MSQKFILTIFLFLVIAFPIKLIAQNNIAKTKTYAVVIGITKYQNKAIPALSYADKDASLFADWLKSSKENNLEEDNLKLFLNEEATISNIYSSFNQLKSQVSENDLVYIYFSGHGDIETDNKNSKGYLLAWNSPSNNYINNAIAVSDLNDLANTLTTINKAKVILITDACHSGKMAGDFYKGRELTANNLRLVLNNQVRLASCQANELAAEGPGWGGGRGIFSYYLLRGLQGFAKADSNDKISVEILQSYLDSSFKTDVGLKIEKHTQHPVIDGSPIFPLTTFDSAVYLNAKNKGAALLKTSNSENSGLQSLRSLGVQPIDYFFSIANKADLDSMLDYKNYALLSATEIPRKIVSDYLEKLISLKNTFEAIYKEDADKLTEQMEIQLHERDEDIIQSLLTQLESNKFLVDRFNENLVQLVHKKCQEMVNAYLTGDLAELEKRQYYNTGKKPYANFLNLIQIAINITPENNYLYKILNINKYYLSGLEQRMQMAISQKDSDSLLQKAFRDQQQASALEPYAAYIQNEIGNLYMHTKNFDSAFYYFNYASALAPTWAVPYSNKIRLYFALHKPDEAYKAIQIADSLQPNLAFVNVNAGLVMEKDSNWLAAEAYYLNAIAQNNIHYLPYERLGFVYLNTGDYTKAEKYFKEAALRKNSFAVNDKVFVFGVEAGGHVNTPAPQNDIVICNSLEEKTIKGWADYLALIKIIPKVDSIKNVDAKEMIALSSLFQKNTQLPFVAHYLGKKYFELNNFSKAEEILKQAIKIQIPKDDLKEILFSKLKKELDDSRTDAEKEEFSKNSCLLISLQNFDYDYLEDYYMLTKIYEQNNNLPEAIKLYKKASVIENNKLLDQANYKNYIIKNDPPNYEELNYTYETPVKMIANLKMAQLYEQLRKYDSSEIIILAQINKNRAAGFARQAQINLGNTGVTGSPVNYFWLLANEDFEAYIFNFYTRMLAQFPRDGEWYKKAGLFLHERLALTFNQIPLKERKSFYTYSLTAPYPYQTGEEGPNPSEEAVTERLKIINEFQIPVTKENVKIEMKIYDPLLSAVNFLNQAIKYSGDIKPSPQLLLSLAELYSWMGNTEEAINSFEKYLIQKPADVVVRNQLIDFLNANCRFVAESNQLTILNNKNNLVNDQVLKLAGYKIFSNQTNEAKILLAKYSANNAADINNLINCRIQIFIKEKNYNKSLSLLKDSLTFKIYDSIKASQGSEKKNLEDENYFNSIYAQVRLFALLNEDKKALTLLKEKANAGYQLSEVLKNDPLLNNIRKKKSWNNVLSGYTNVEAETNDDDSENKYRSSLNYRIPKKE